MDLTISRSIAESHGGLAVGYGLFANDRRRTTFHFTLQLGKQSFHFSSFPCAFANSAVSTRFRAGFRPEHILGGEPGGAEWWSPESYTAVFTGS